MVNKRQLKSRKKFVPCTYSFLTLSRDENLVSREGGNLLLSGTVAVINSPEVLKFYEFVLPGLKSKAITFFKKMVGQGSLGQNMELAITYPMLCLNREKSCKVFSVLGNEKIPLGNDYFDSA